MIIDFHTHAFPDRIREEREPLLAAEPLFSILYSSPRAKLASAQEVVESMDRDGVDQSVLLNVAWSSPALCRETNDYILDAVAKYGGRLVGFCSVPLGEADAAAREAERCTLGGARGIGELRPDLWGFAPGDRRRLMPLVEVARRHRLILLLHTSEPVGHSYPGKGNATPGQVFQFIEAFPDLPIVCAHWGGGLPFYALMPEVARALENTYYDTAASPFLYRPAVYQAVAGLVGEEKLLFGSDFPLIPQRRALSELTSLSLPAEARELILGGNARRLLSRGDR